VESQARTGSIAERMVGPRHPLPNEDRARTDNSWRATASELAALRQLHAVEIQATRFRARQAAASLRRRDEALVRQGFVHRFLVAMQETCAAKRAAMVAQITTEQEAAVAQVREKARAEAKGRIERSLAPVRARHRNEQHGLRVARRTQQRRAAPKAASRNPTRDGPR